MVVDLRRRGDGKPLPSRWTTMASGVPVEPHDLLHVLEPLDRLPVDLTITSPACMPACAAALPGPNWTDLGRRERLAVGRKAAPARRSRTRNWRSARRRRSPRAARAACEERDLALGRRHVPDGAARRAGGVGVAEHLDVAAERDRAELPARAGAVPTSRTARGRSRSRRPRSSRRCAGRPSNGRARERTRARSARPGNARRRSTDRWRNSIGSPACPSVQVTVVFAGAHESTRLRGGASRIEMAYRIQIIEAGMTAAWPAWLQRRPRCRGNRSGRRGRRATAVSLAAFSTVGRRPRVQGLARKAQRRKAARIGRLEGQRARSRRGRAAPPAPSIRPGQPSA